MKSVTHKSNVKSLFNDANIQCPIKTLNMIDDHFKREIQSMVTKCKEGNVKRLTTDLLWVALGKY